MDRGTCDLIVIGSGFGGAVVALRASQAGLQVVALERGQRLTTQVYEDIGEGRGPIFHGPDSAGPLELHRLKGLLALTASAVGGGSNVYTAVTTRPADDVFDDGWPTGFDSRTLAAYLDHVEQVIGPTPVPQLLARTAALEAIGRRLGVGITRLPLAMIWPDDPAVLETCASANDGVYRELATWLQGGRAARKRTLDHTYLAQAEVHGADVRPLHTVDSIRPDDGGYRVTFRAQHNGTLREGDLWAKRVIVAAGTFGTIRLLLRCRDVFETLPHVSSVLGEGFYTNGDFGGLLVRPQFDVAPDAGPPVTAWLDAWDRDRMYIMETGLVPYDFGSFAGLLNPASWTHFAQLAPVKRCTWSFGVMGPSPSQGRLTLRRKKTLIHRHDQRLTGAFLARAADALRNLAEAAGGKLMIPPAILARRLPVTVHPLGGAAMADSPDAGVTNPYGEVFGHPGLYVCDGSLIPVPTGVPPSMTIAALAERNIEHLIRQW
jgi:cholesterol oxidase